MTFRINSCPFRIIALSLYCVKNPLEFKKAKKTIVNSGNFSNFAIRKPNGKVKHPEAEKHH